jgi:hypothetical protein
LAGEEIYSKIEYRNGVGKYEISIGFLGDRQKGQGIILSLR